MNHMLPRTNKSGFSLIELLVVIGIISTLLLVGVSALVSYYRIQTFNVAVAEVVTMLQTAKSYSQSQVTTCPTGKKLTGYLATFWNPQGKGYSLSIECDGQVERIIEAKNLPDNITFGQLVSMKFDLLTGQIVAGSNTITIKGYNRCQNIVINPLGGISLEEANKGCTP